MGRGVDGGVGGGVAGGVGGGGGVSVGLIIFSRFVGIDGNADGILFAAAAKPRSNKMEIWENLFS